MRPSLIVPSYFCIGSGIVVSLPATAGECTRPDATALSSEQAKLEGEVRVTVLNVGGGASAAGEQHKEWESQLPSQSAVDNQWYLYYLCQEYEARRITRDQYCAISSGIWERIVGRPVAMGECAGQVPQSTYTVSAPVAAAPASAATPAAVVADDDMGWMWPANGAVLNGFDEAKNKGLDIGGASGDAVLAAADGRVVYAGAGLRGYGNLIILKHNNVYLTAYAHNNTLLVKEDATVKKGQKIAEMGDSDADRVKLHFEVRKQGKPVDPAKYMPAR